MKKSVWSVLAVTVMSAVLMMPAAAYANQETIEGGAETAAASSELSQEEMDALMEQVAETEVTRSYEEYLQDEAFARAEVFGIDREGDEAAAYVCLTTEEFVVLKGKAYEQSGSMGEAIIRFEYTENGPKLKEVVWSEDGAGHDEWMKENFPEEYLQKSISYYGSFTDSGSNFAGIIPEVEAALGVPVETENLLTIDTENGTYEIVKVIETFEPEYKFETEIVEAGDLSSVTD